MGKHLDRAEILLDLDKYDLAEQELRQEIAENPDSDLAHGSLARCLINQGQVGPETLTILEYALSLNADNDWLHYLLATYWHLKGDFDRAQAAIGVAIELDPNLAPYFDTLARILFDRGANQFKTHSRRVLLMIFIVSHGSLLPIGIGLLSVCKGYWLRSYLRPVLTPLQQSLALDPEYLSIVNLQTKLFITTNRHHQALISSLKALELAPTNANAHRLHAQILLRADKYTAAIDHFQSSLNIDPSSTEAKAGLLEAIRSTYRIYPWLSITNWRGKLVLSAIFLATVAIGISTIWLKTENLWLLVIYLVLIPAVCISLAAKIIFNLLLQLKPNYQLLITNSISTENTVLSNYLASVVISIISLIYPLTILLLLLNNPAAQSIISMILGTSFGIFITTATFLPVTNRQKIRSFPMIYQLTVGGLGLINLLLCIFFVQVGTVTQFFVGLVFLSPLFASGLTKKS
jgi:tetratricopeptide (TPR) repeat protein